MSVPAQSGPDSAAYPPALTQSVHNVYPPWTPADLPPLLPPKQQEQAWLRLDPRSIATFPFAQGLPLLLGLTLTAIAGGHVRGVAVRLVIEVSLLAVLGLVRWWRFGYRVVDGRLETRSGLLARQSKAINVDRIRGVEIEARLVHRLTGVCALHVDHPGAAGGARGRNRNARDRIDAISRAEGERLRGVLLHERAAAAPGQGGLAVARAADAVAASALSGARPVPPSERVLFRLPTAWLAYAPFSLRLLGVGPAVVLGSIGYLNDARIDPGSLASSFAHGAGFTIAVLTVLVVVMLVAVAGAGIGYWRWTVTARGDDLVITRGLLTRRTSAIERRRLRGVVLREPLLGRPVRAASLAVELSGVTGASSAALVPLGPAPELSRFAREFVPPCSQALVSHPVGARRRRQRRAAVPGLVLAAIGVGLVFVDEPVGGGLLVASVVAGVVGQLWARASYRSLGHAVDERVVSARHGVLERRTQTVDRRYPIGLRVRQSVFARRAGVASVDIALVARGHTRISDMAAADVEALARTLLAPRSGAPRGPFFRN